LAVTVLEGTNAAPRSDKGPAGWVRGDWAVARSNRKGIIANMVTKMKRDGYPPVKHCSKMDRPSAVASPSMLC